MPPDLIRFIADFRKAAQRDVIARSSHLCRSDNHLKPKNWGLNRVEVTIGRHRNRDLDGLVVNLD